MSLQNCAHVSTVFAVGCFTLRSLDSAASSRSRCHQCHDAHKPQLPVNKKMVTLIQLVRGKQYEEALEHLKAHPESVLEKDEDGRTALQKICQETNAGDPGVTLAQAMLDIRPELIHEGNLEQGRMLLHYTVCRSLIRAPRSTDLALVLMSADPAAVSVSARDGSGFTPFHTACYADSDIVMLRAMLQVNPQLAGDIRQGKTPIELLLRQNGWNTTGEALEKIALILLVNFKGRVVDPLPMQEIVHAVCAYPLPLTFLTRIMRAFPEQVHQTDEHGHLPLHYAVKNVGIWDNSSNPFVHSNFLFQKLMKVVRANPSALLTIDPTDGLYPALVSAVKSDDNTIHLSVTYQLLKEAPEMIAQAILYDTP